MLQENRFWLFLLISISVGILVFDSSEATQTNEEKQIECNYLNSIRANFTYCCFYPVLVMWRWQWEFCAKDCPPWNTPEFRCCHTPCAFKSLNVLVENEENPEVLRVDYKGLVYSFLLSIGNDSRWIGTLETSAKTCFEQFDGANEGYECGVIPYELYTIIYCSYNENFIRCPTMRQIPECRDTVRFVKKCLRGDD